MPTNSRVMFGFQFLTPTGRNVKSEAKKARALLRFLRSNGAVNDLEGVHVVARWSNPDDKAQRSREWKTTEDPGQSLSDFYETMSEILHGAGVEDKARQRLERNQGERDKARAAKVPNKSKGSRSARPKRKMARVSKRNAKGGYVRSPGMGKKRKKAQRTKGRKA